MNPHTPRFDISRSAVHQIGLSCNTIPPHRYGGIETVITNLSRGLIARGADVVVYSPGDLHIPGARHVRTLPAPVSGPREGVNVANIIEHLDIIRRSIEETYQSGDIVHLHHQEQAKVLSGMQEKHYLAVETAHWRRVGLSDHIIYPSQSLREQVGRPGIVIPHGVDLDMFHWTKNARRENFIFYAGRITPDKGVHLAAEACKQAGIEFWAAGPRPDTAYAEQALRDAKFLGELTHAELCALYNRALATVYLTQYIEPFGLSVVESLACGCPVITTGLGGTGEIVLHGKHGFICSNTTEIISAILKIQDIKAEDCVERAFDFSIERMTDSVIDYYNNSYA